MECWRESPIGVTFCQAMVEDRDSNQDCGITIDMANGRPESG